MLTNLEFAMHRIELFWDESPMSMLEPWSAARYLANPYSYYRRLRATNPVYWNPELKLWTVTRYVDAAAALTHPALSSRRPAPAVHEPAERMVYDALSTWLLRSDPPAHTRLRALATPSLQGRVSGMRTRIEAHAEQLLDAAQPNDVIEVISEYAAPLVFSSIAALIGIPPQDYHQFQHWSEDIGAAAESSPDARLLARAQHSLDEVSAYFRSLTAHRRLEPADDLLSGLINPESNGERLNDLEIAALCTLLLLAGLDTATHLLANGILALLQHPDQLDALRADPVVRQGAVQELLRYDSPLQGVLRLAVDDLELAGKRIEGGQTVLVWLAAANRDPEQFEQPDRLEIHRTPNRHLAFGSGIHHCLGASLGLMIVGVGLDRLLSRARNLRLASDRTAWQGNFVFRSQRALHVRL